ncbi:MAG: hypothetical protein FJ150_02810 [Euryarchaeota archaeon]|nr:hypothetical protein [Euryarchaeota archaeon]
MSKTMDIVMAGVISGIVAFTTSQIGIAGTVLGAVLGAMLYQVMSHYVREPLGRVKTQKVETRIVYAFPLILILIIEVIYVLSLLYLKPQQIFYFLEGLTGWNLFRAIGIGLLCMGIYPIIQPENIKRLYGYIILALGIIALLHGFIDIESPIIDIYSFIYYEFSMIISLIEIAALIFVIISIIKESVTIIREDDQNEG